MLPGSYCLFLPPYIQAAFFPVLDMIDHFDYFGRCFYTVSVSRTNSCRFFSFFLIIFLIKEIHLECLSGSLG